MGDKAQGRTSGVRNSGASSIGSQPAPSTAGFQAQRARARSGALSGRQHPSDGLKGEKPGANYNAKRRKILDEVRSHAAVTSKTGNDPAAKQQPRSKPTPAERYTPRDGGHRNPQE